MTVDEVIFNSDFAGFGYTLISVFRWLAIGTASEQMPPSKTTTGYCATAVPHVLVNVYNTVSMPLLTPANKLLAEPMGDTVAIPALVVQIPPATVSFNVAEWPIQRVSSPVIVPADG